MLLLDRLSDGGDEGGDFGLEIWMGAKFSDAADDGAANNDSIAFLGDLSGLFGGGNAESDGDGEVRVGFDFANLGTDAGREASLLAGDAFAGDVVNEALCGFRNQLHAIGGVVGAMSRMARRLWDFISSAFRAASSGGRSRIRTPSAPAAEASAWNLSKP